MSDETTAPGGGNRPANETTGKDARTDRLFLCVVDSTEECRIAIYFAVRRMLRASGRLALLYIMKPAEFQHWMSVEEKMREEARTEAEEFLQQYASQVKDWTGEMPTLYVREGQPAETILNLIKEEPRISILVLGAGTDKKGPGPLVSAIVGKMSGEFPIPITVVPGNLSQEQIDLLT